MANTNTTNYQNHCEVNTWTVTNLIDSTLENPSKKNRVIIPKYQRNLVWSEKQKREFIASLKKGFPFGSLLLYKQGADGQGVLKHTLVDGLQRTTTIKSYVDQPTKFFESNLISPDMITEILEVLSLDFDDENRLIRVITDWVKQLRGFEESQGYSSFNLAKEILEKLDVEQDGNTLGTLTNSLIPFKEKLEKESDISNIQIPIIIYSGESKNLPTIFERLNSKGTQLNKYQIYAATWSTNDPVKILNTKIIDLIKKKYDSLIEEGLQIDNYDPYSKDFYTGTFNIFEYVFGFGKYISQKHPEIFGKNSNNDPAKTDSIGFNVCAVCLGLDINQMDKLPELINKVNSAHGLKKFEEAVLSATSIISQKLKPFIELKANKKKNSTYKPTIYHTEYQIVSFIGKVFRSKYDTNLQEKSSWVTKKVSLLENISFHYLYDILRDIWRGSGDSRVKELIQEESRYEREIYQESWESVLNEWFEGQMQRREKQRVGIKDSDVLFLKYIYSHLFTSYQDSSTVEFEIEHLVPISKLKEISEDGLPISAVSNLCFIEKEINRWKSDSTIYQYYEKLVVSEELTQEQANQKIAELEIYTMTTRDELNFVENLSSEDYLEFLKTHFDKLKNQFFELNKIKPNPEKI